MTTTTSTVIELIVEERQRQITEEGWTTEHDDEHVDGELADAAACYAMNVRTRLVLSWRSNILRSVWPKSWTLNWWKPSSDNRIRDLVKAGALIVAEIERLQRQETKD